MTKRFKEFAEGRGNYPPWENMVTFTDTALMNAMELLAAYIDYRFNQTKEYHDE